MNQHPSIRQRASSTRRVPSSVLIESWGGAAGAAAVGAAIGVRSSHQFSGASAGGGGSTASSSSSAGIVPPVNPPPFGFGGLLQPQPHHSHIASHHYHSHHHRQHSRTTQSVPIQHGGSGSDMGGRLRIPSPHAPHALSQQQQYFAPPQLVTASPTHPENHHHHQHQHHHHHQHQRTASSSSSSGLHPSYPPPLAGSARGVSTSGRRSSPGGALTVPMTAASVGPHLGNHSAPIMPPPRYQTGLNRASASPMESTARTGPTVVVAGLVADTNRGSTSARSHSRDSYEEGGVQDSLVFRHGNRPQQPAPANQHQHNQHQQQFRQPSLLPPTPPPASGGTMAIAASTVAAARSRSASKLSSSGAGGIRGGGFGRNSGHHSEDSSSILTQTGSNSTAAIAATPPPPAFGAAGGAGSSSGRSASSGSHYLAQRFHSGVGSSGAGSGAGGSSGQLLLPPFAPPVSSDTASRLGAIAESGRAVGGRAMPTASPIDAAGTAARVPSSPPFVVPGRSTAVMVAATAVPSGSGASQNNNDGALAPPTASQEDRHFWGTCSLDAQISPAETQVVIVAADSPSGGSHDPSDATDEALIGSLVSPPARSDTALPSHQSRRHLSPAARGGSADDADTANSGITPRHHTTLLVVPPGVAPGIITSGRSTSPVSPVAAGAPSSARSATAYAHGPHAPASTAQQHEQAVVDTMRSEDASVDSTGSGFFNMIRRKLPLGRRRGEGAEVADSVRPTGGIYHGDGSGLDRGNEIAEGVPGGGPTALRAWNSTAPPPVPSSSPRMPTTRGGGREGGREGGRDENGFGGGNANNAAGNGNAQSGDTLSFSNDKDAGGFDDGGGAQDAGDEENGVFKTPCTLALGTVLRGVVICGFVVAIISAFTPVYIKGREANTELMVHLREQTIYRTGEQLKYRFQVATDAVTHYAAAGFLVAPFAAPFLTVPPGLNGSAATLLAGVADRTKLVTYACMTDNAIGTPSLLYCDPTWDANQTTATAAPADAPQNITSSIAPTGFLIQDIPTSAALCTAQVQSVGAWDYFATTPRYGAPADFTTLNSSWMNMSFDARTRPWFAAGSKQTSPSWTEIYMDIRGFAVVTAVAPLVDPTTLGQVGVVAADFSSRDIALYMTPLQVSANGRSILLDSDTRTIWGTNFEQQDLYYNADDTQRLARWRDVTDPLLVRVRETLGEDWPFQGSGLRSLTIGDGAFHRNAVAVDVTDIRDNFGLNMRLLIAIPEADFARVMWDGAILAIGVTIGVGLAVLILVVLVLSGVSAALARVVDSLYAAAYLDVGGPSGGQDGTDADATGEPLSTHPFARWIEEIVRIDGAFGVLRAELAQIKGFLPAHIIAASEARTNNTSDLASYPTGAQGPAEGRGAHHGAASGGVGADRVSIASTILRGRIGRGGSVSSMSRGEDGPHGGWDASGRSGGAGDSSILSSSGTTASTVARPSPRQQRPRGTSGAAAGSSMGSFTTVGSPTTSSGVTRPGSAATFAGFDGGRGTASDANEDELGSVSVAAAAAAAASQQLQLQQQRAHSLLVAPHTGTQHSGPAAPGAALAAKTAASRTNSPAASIPFDMSVLRQAGLQLGFGGGRLSARRVTVAAVNLWRFCASAAAFAAAEGDDGGGLGGAGPGGGTGAAGGGSGKAKRSSRRSMGGNGGPHGGPGVSGGVGPNTTASAHQRQLATLDSVRAAHFIGMRSVEAAANATTGSLDSFVGDLIWVSWNAATSCVSHRERGIEFLARLSADADGDRYTTAGASTSLAYLGVLGTQRVKRFAIVGPCTGQALYLERMCSRYPLAPAVSPSHTAAVAPNPAPVVPTTSASLNASSWPQLQQQQQQLLRHPLGVSAGAGSDVTGRSGISAGASAFLSYNHPPVHLAAAPATAQPVMRVANLISGTMLDGAPADLMAVPLDALHLPTGSYAHAENVLPRNAQLSASQAGHAAAPTDALWPLQEKRSPLATVLPWVMQPARGGTMGAGGGARVHFHGADDPMAALWVDATSNAPGRGPNEFLRSGLGDTHNHQSLRDDASARIYAAIGEMETMSDGPVYGSETTSPTSAYHRLPVNSGIVTGGPLPLPPSATLGWGGAGASRTTTGDIYRYALASLVDGYFCLCRNEHAAARNCLQRAQDRFASFLPLASVAIDPDTPSPTLPVEADALAGNRFPSSGDYTPPRPVGASSNSNGMTFGPTPAEPSPPPAAAGGLASGNCGFVIEGNYNDAERKALVRALHLLQRGIQRLADTLEAQATEKRLLAAEMEVFRATQRVRMGLATAASVPRVVVPPLTTNNHNAVVPVGDTSHDQPQQRHYQHQQQLSASGYGNAANVSMSLVATPAISAPQSDLLPPRDLVVPPPLPSPVALMKERMRNDRTGCEPLVTHQPQEQHQQQQQHHQQDEQRRASWITTSSAAKLAAAAAAGTMDSSSGGVAHVATAPATVVSLSSAAQVTAHNTTGATTTGKNPSPTRAPGPAQIDVRVAAPPPPLVQTPSWSPGLLSDALLPAASPLSHRGSSSSPRPPHASCANANGPGLVADAHLLGTSCTLDATIASGLGLSASLTPQPPLLASGPTTSHVDGFVQDVSGPGGAPDTESPRNGAQQVEVVSGTRLAVLTTAAPTSAAHSPGPQTETPAGLSFLNGSDMYFGTTVTPGGAAAATGASSVFSPSMLGTATGAAVGANAATAVYNQTSLGTTATTDAATPATAASSSRASGSGFGVAAGALAGDRAPGSVAMAATVAVSVAVVNSAAHNEPGRRKSLSAGSTSPLGPADGAATALIGSIPDEAHNYDELPVRTHHSDVLLRAGPGSLTTHVRAPPHLRTQTELHPFSPLPSAPAAIQTLLSTPERQHHRRRVSGGGAAAATAPCTPASFEGVLATPPHPQHPQQHLPGSIGVGTGAAGTAHSTPAGVSVAPGGGAGGTPGPRRLLVPAVPTIVFPTIAGTGDGPK